MAKQIQAPKLGSLNWAELITLILMKTIHKGEIKPSAANTHHESLTQKGVLVHVNEGSIKLAPDVNRLLIQKGHWDELLNFAGNKITLHLSRLKIGELMLLQTITTNGMKAFTAAKLPETGGRLVKTGLVEEFIPGKLVANTDHWEAISSQVFVDNLKKLLSDRASQ